MSKTKLGSNSTYISNGNSLNYIGNHAYAYNSGSFNNVETTLLQFDTGKKYVLGIIFVFASFSYEYKSTPLK